MNGTIKLSVTFFEKDNFISILSRKRCEEVKKEYFEEIYC